MGAHLVLGDIIPYEPAFWVKLERVADVVSAWTGIDLILYDIVNRFNIPQKRALEFGVEHGYSTSDLANVFDYVRVVDTFVGDQHSGFHSDDLHNVRERLRPWPNIELIQARYQDYIHFD